MNCINCVTNFPPGRKKLNFFSQNVITQLLLADGPNMLWEMCYGDTCLLRDETQVK